MNKLKPCPFCGSKAKLKNIKPFNDGKHKGIERWQVMCSGCTITTGGFLEKETAVTMWNVRMKEGDAG